MARRLHATEQAQDEALEERADVFKNGSHLASDPHRRADVHGGQWGDDVCWKALADGGPGRCILPLDRSGTAIETELSVALPKRVPIRKPVGRPRIAGKVLRRGHRRIRIRSPNGYGKRGTSACCRRARRGRRGGEGECGAGAPGRGRGGGGSPTPGSGGDDGSQEGSDRANRAGGGAAS